MKSSHQKSADEKQKQLKVSNLLNCKSNEQTISKKGDPFSQRRKIKVGLFKTDGAFWVGI
uniref:Uncharacterized protein n=1 Tax=Solanum lycopersicum TaxID=4081 RepID=A0A3Q7G064_SOLLC